VLKNIMKKVLFVDERFYRFNHYYEKKDWWVANKITPIFKGYEGRLAKYFIYLSLLTNRPAFIVIVQLCTKNLILVRLANLLGIKVVFWQHGVFKYPVYVKSYIKGLNLKLDLLLTLSKYDEDNISHVFNSVTLKKQIPHYDLAHIKPFKGKDEAGVLKIAYIAQIVSRQQIMDSKAVVLEQYLGDTDYFSLVVSCIDESQLKIKLLVRKHPGDKSKYLHELCEKYDFMELCDTDEVFTADISITHNSTLILAFFTLGKRIIQLPYTNGTHLLDLSVYDDANMLHRVESASQFLDVIAIHKSQGSKKQKSLGEYETISEQLVSSFQ
jgi:hypothetical protein